MCLQVSLRRHVARCDDVTRPDGTTAGSRVVPSPNRAAPIGGFPGGDERRPAAQRSLRNATPAVRPTAPRSSGRVRARLERDASGACRRASGSPRSRRPDHALAALPREAALVGHAGLRGGSGSRRRSSRPRSGVERAHEAARTELTIAPDGGVRRAQRDCREPHLPRAPERAGVDGERTLERRGRQRQPTVPVPPAWSTAPVGVRRARPSAEACGASRRRARRARRGLHRARRTTSPGSPTSRSRGPTPARSLRAHAAAHRREHARAARPKRPPRRSCRRPAGGRWTTRRRRHPEACTLHESDAPALPAP